MSLDIQRYEKISHGYDPKISEMAKIYMDRHYTSISLATWDIVTDSLDASAPGQEY